MKDISKARVYDALASLGHGWHFPAAVVRLTGLSRHTVYARLNDLEKDGLAVNTGIYGSRRWHLKGVGDSKDVVIGSPEELARFLSTIKDGEGKSVLQLLYDGEFTLFLDVAREAAKAKNSVLPAVVHLQDIGVVKVKMVPVSSAERNVKRQVRKFYIADAHKSWVKELLSKPEKLRRGVSV
jgi:DNA-binding Lrp family transcriptional regulator